MRIRSTAWLAWACCALTVTLLVGPIPLLMTAIAAASAPGAAFPAHVIDALSWSVPELVGDLSILVSYVMFSTLGALIVARHPMHRIGWIFCAIGLLGALQGCAKSYALYALVITPGALGGGVAAAWLNNWIWVVHDGLLTVFLPLLFPDGRLVSPRWRWVGWLAGGVMALLSLAAAFHAGPVFNAGGLVDINNPLGIGAITDFITFPIGAAVPPLFLFCILAALISLGLRLQRTMGDERQQIKWVVYFATILAVLWVAQSLVRHMLAISTPAFELVWSLAYGCAFIGLPTAAGLAILKYRLYDIDVIINRTLVYSLLTGALAATYVGSVVLLQAVVRALTGQARSELVTVAATLAIAVLFNPLRKRIQTSIDRRFYRRKYDAAKTLATFSARLRDETDLEQLSADLLAVVEETMQPAHVSLWLHDAPTRARRRSAVYPPFTTQPR